MKLNEIFKAINLRVTTSKPYSKNFYGKNCREFTFEDCYGNDVGSFIIHPEGDVCQVIVKSIINSIATATTSANNLSKDSTQGSNLCSVVYRWINPLSIALREHLLSQKENCEKLRESYVFNHIPYNQILESHTILEIVSSTCKGQVFLLNDLNNPKINNDEIKGEIKSNILKNKHSDEDINDEVFLKLAKVAYMKNISVEDLLGNLFDSVNNNDSSSANVISKNIHNLIDDRNKADDESDMNSPSKNNINLNFRNNMNDRQQSSVEYNSYNIPTHISSHISNDINNFKKNDDFLNTRLTGSGVKKYVENRFTEDFSLRETVSPVSLLKDVGKTDGSSIEKSNIESLNINDDNLLSVEDSLNVKLPECIDGSFMIGRGFVPQRLNTKKALKSLIQDSDVENLNFNKKSVNKVVSPAYGHIGNSNVGVSKSMLGEDTQMTLRERVFSSINPINLSDGLKKNIYRYPGEKTVLSNLKPIV